jgi:tetratricopeptide (TPR) repeat protein
VKQTERRAIAAVSFILAAVVSAPMTATAQRTSERVPYFIAVTFRAPANEPKLGIDVAEGLRQRMIKLFPQPARAGGLRIVTRKEINDQLTNAGYPADSAISTTDLRDLGRNVGAAETLEGTTVRTADGIQAKARFYSNNLVAAPEVLPTVVDKDPAGVGRQLADLYAKARRELPDYNNCRNALIANQLDQAIVAAKAAMQQFDKGVLPRACLMSVYFKLSQQNKMPLDSTIKVGQDILQIDPDNELAIGQLADAYLVKGDTARSVEMNVKLYRLNPTNTSQAKTIIQILAGTGAPAQAVPIVRALLASNQGDVAILETYWKLLQATKDWKQAIAIGEEMVKFDSSKADPNYFDRQITAALADSQPRLAIQYLARAAEKYPKSTHYWLGYSQELRKAGQLQQSLDAAKKALAVDPKVEGGQATVLGLYVALGQADSALSFAKQALAAGASRPSIGATLLPLINPAYKKADASNARPDWEALYQMAATVDSIAPTPTTAFFMSYSAYNVGTQALTGIAALVRADRVKACAENRVAADMFLVVDLNMGRGSSINQDAAVKILRALDTYKPYIDQYRRTIPCR